ncbi:MAG: hypothetical protein MUF86_05810 [Akkermansiaceae bacterium]|jgi:hypothetical protein|nr:hypothetical protein [Akkermansiaceae bacterium]
MKNPWFLPSAMLLLGAIGGFLSGRNTSSATDSADADIARPTRSAQRSDASGAADAANKRGTRPLGVDEISRLPGNSNRIQALIAFYSGLSPEQLEDEARKLESLPMNERIMASFLLFGRWAEVDPTAAMSFSNTMGFTGMFVRPTILQSWASVDPANAAKYYADNPREFAMMGMMGGGRGPMGGQGGAAIIAGEWARQDPAGALAWANTLTTEKSQALSSVVGEVAKTDPKKAAEMLTSMGGGDLRDAYRRVAEQYGAADFNEAQSWIRTLPADQQAEALASAIGGLSNKDPQAAARQLLQMQDGEAKNRVLGEVVGDWARVNPTAAADLLKSQGDPEAQRDGMRQLMPTWVGQNPTAALEYAYSYEAGPVRDSALQSYVWSNQSAAPAELVKVAESIGDDRDRSRTIGIATSRWMREEPEQAKTYIQQSTTLSDEAKERILSGEPMWGGGRGRGRGRD